MRAAVVVLGDLGHSPRMSYHAHSLSSNGLTVDLIGYSGSELHPLISNDENIIVHQKTSPFKVSRNKLLFIPTALLKIIFQFFQFLFCLLSVPRSDYILVQNPPSMPILTVVFIVKLIRNSKVIIDWHNFGYTILGMKHKGLAPLLLKQYEKFFGKCGDLHFCVSFAMKTFLHSHFGIPQSKITVLYDRPSPIFKPLSLKEKHDFMEEISPSLGFDTNPITYKKGREVKRKHNSVFAVSSTSWTPDEDFTPLYEAICQYDHFAREEDLPLLNLVITGRGPLQETFKDKINQSGLKKVVVAFAWLQAKDYPTLIASADFGISLHQSSSKLDLPMKILDMFGCGVPVLAVHYDCIEELVIPLQFGFLFHNSDDLCKLLVRWTRDLYYSSGEIDLFRNNIIQYFASQSWQSNWNDVVKPLLVHCQ
ncbi:hypothetical protein P9112_007217 [Eukaryota sp. TZLM1-RC]